MRAEASGLAALERSLKKMPVDFVNVDLEVESHEPLDYLALELADSEVRRLYCGETKGGYVATFECDKLGESEPNSLIKEFCDALTQLDERALKLWEGAHRKTFDIGYEANNESDSYRSEIRSDAVQAVADAGATIMLTIYPKHKSEQDVPAKSDRSGG